jgi:hypothetical protein
MNNIVNVKSVTLRIKCRTTNVTHKYIQSFAHSVTGISHWHNLSSAFSLIRWNTYSNGHVRYVNMQYIFTTVSRLKHVPYLYGYAIETYFCTSRNKVRNIEIVWKDLDKNIYRTWNNDMKYDKQVQQGKAAFNERNPNPTQ